MSNHCCFLPISNPNLLWIYRWDYMVQIKHSYVMLPSEAFCLLFYFCKSTGAGGHRQESPLFPHESTTLPLKSVQFSSINKNWVKINLAQWIAPASKYPNDNWVAQCIVIALLCMNTNNKTSSEHAMCLYHSRGLNKTILRLKGLVTSCCSFWVGMSCRICWFIVRLYETTE